MPAASKPFRFFAAVTCQLGFAAAVAAPVSAADSAPRWEIGEICASSTLGAQCPRIESQNRSTLLLRWESVPADARTACKASVEDGGKPSYKLLLNCIEAQQLKALENGAGSAPL